MNRRLVVTLAAVRSSNLTDPIQHEPVLLLALHSDAAAWVDTYVCVPG